MTYEEELERCGEITHDEAHELALSYIDHAFGNDKRPGYYEERPGRRVTHSIPANPRRDTDLRLCSYIRQQKLRGELVASQLRDAEKCAESVAAERDMLAEALENIAALSGEAALTQSAPWAREALERLATAKAER